MVPSASGSRPEKVTPESVLSVTWFSVPAGMDNPNRLWMPDSERVQSREPPRIESRRREQRVWNPACWTYAAVEANLHYFDVRASVLVVGPCPDKHESPVIPQPATQRHIDEPLKSGDFAIRARRQIDHMKQRRSRAR